MDLTVFGPVQPIAKYYPHFSTRTALSEAIKPKIKKCVVKPMIYRQNFVEWRSTQYFPFTMVDKNIDTYSTEKSS